MQKKSTLSSFNSRKHVADGTTTLGNGSKCGPKDSTLFMLRQFARAYCFESALAPAVGAMVLN